jgi:hypothetical protein
MFQTIILESADPEAMNCPFAEKHNEVTKINEKYTNFLLSLKSSATKIVGGPVNTYS